MQQQRGGVCVKEEQKCSWLGSWDLCSQNVMLEALRMQLANCFVLLLTSQ